MSGTGVRAWRLAFPDAAAGNGEGAI